MDFYNFLFTLIFSFFIKLLHLQYNLLFHIFDFF